MGTRTAFSFPNRNVSASHKHRINQCQVLTAWNNLELSGTGQKVLWNCFPPWTVPQDSGKCIFRPHANSKKMSRTCFTRRISLSQGIKGCKNKNKGLRREGRNAERGLIGVGKVGNDKGKVSKLEANLFFVERSVNLRFFWKTTELVRFPLATPCSNRFISYGFAFIPPASCVNLLKAICKVMKFCYVSAYSQLQINYVGQGRRPNLPQGGAWPTGIAEITLRKKNTLAELFNYVIERDSRANHQMSQKNVFVMLYQDKRAFSRS